MRIRSSRARAERQTPTAQCHATEHSTQPQHATATHLPYCAVCNIFVIIITRPHTTMVNATCKGDTQARRHVARGDDATEVPTRAARGRSPLSLRLPCRCTPPNVGNLCASLQVCEGRGTHGLERPPLRAPRLPTRGVAHLAPLGSGPSAPQPGRCGCSARRRLVDLRL
jgi:hypothetical protein